MTSYSSSRDDGDALDVREIARALRRGRRWVIGGLVGGVLAGVLATVLLRTQFEGTSLVLLRDSPEAGTSALGQLGGLGGLMGSLPLSLESGLETELEILTSRTVAGAVIDSLGLQARIRSPDGTGPAEVFSEARYDAEVPRKSIYTFERSGAAYRVEGRGVSGVAVPGTPYALPFGTVTLRSAGLPPEFRVEFLAREDAITGLLKRLDAENTAGEVAELVYRADDRYNAAAVPNALVAHYLSRRRTTDRGVNQRRYEFLEAKADSLGTELALAEGALRRYQESSGVLDPELQGEAALERATVLRKELEAIEVEIRALQQLVQQSAAGELSPRQLAAYPTFLRNPAINDLLSRLLELETDRTQLGQRRTDADPEMVALQNSVDHLEGQLTSLSQSYISGLVRQRASLRSELEDHRAQLAVLPGQAEESFRLQREVKRLTETLIAVHAQLVHAHLAAIGEGGDVRQIDAAVPPRRPVFPKAWINLTVGLFGGLLIGVGGALSSAYLSPRVREPRDAELVTGLPAIALGPRTPLLLGGLDDLRTVLVLPVGNRAHPTTAARRIAGAAAARGRSVVLADLATASGPAATEPVHASAATALVAAGNGAALQPVELADGSDYAEYRLPFVGVSAVGPVREVVEELEQRFSLVVVVLSGLDDPMTEALLTERRQVVLVGHPGSLLREELRQVVESFTHAGIRTAGVVLQNGDGGKGGARHA